VSAAGGSGQTVPGAWDALARAAASREAREEKTLVRELLCFILDGDPYAVSVERVREIVRMRAVTDVPRMPPEILGVISLRGEVVEILDMRRRLGMPPAAPTRSSRIVVLHGDEGEVSGLLVDAVREVLRVEESAIRPPPSGESDFVSALCSRGEEFVSFLNLEKVLDLGGD
jgi:purine-binding chemotaxis protein CheW